MELQDRIKRAERSKPNANTALDEKTYNILAVAFTQNKSKPIKYSKTEQEIGLALAKYFKEVTE